MLHYTSEGFPDDLVKKKNPPSMQEAQETLVQFLGLEDPLEKEIATHPSNLAWKIPWTEGPGRATVHGIANSWT